MVGSLSCLHSGLSTGLSGESLEHLIMLCLSSLESWTRVGSALSLHLAWEAWKECLHAFSKIGSVVPLQMKFFQAILMHTR